MKKRKDKSKRSEVKLIFQFSREEVLSQDLTRFLRLFGDSELPHGEPLKKMQGALYITVDGYDDDPRSIAEIPEVRSFFQGFYKIWPYWFYFFVPELLPTMAICLFKQYFGVRADRVTAVRHQYWETDMANFIQEQAVPLQKLCLLSGMTLEDFDRIYYKLAVQLMPSIANAMKPPRGL